MVTLYKKWKKHYEIQLPKNKRLKYSKNDKFSTLPGEFTVEKRSLQAIIHISGLID